MRILVTGGAGFIGVSVVRALVAAGHEVRVLDALLPTVHPTGRAPVLPPGVNYRRGDVRDAAAVEEALAGVDAVRHQAATVGLGLDLDDAPQYVRCDDLGTAVPQGRIAVGAGALQVGRTAADQGGGAHHPQAERHHPGGAAAHGHPAARFRQHGDRDRPRPTREQLAALVTGSGLDARLVGGVPESAGAAVQRAVHRIAQEALTDFLLLAAVATVLSWRRTVHGPRPRSGGTVELPGRDGGPGGTPGDHPGTGVELRRTSGAGRSVRAVGRKVRVGADG